MILNARLETLQQDEVLTRLEQLPSLPPGRASFRKIWIFGALELKYPTSPVMESLGSRILLGSSRGSSHSRQWESF